MCLEIQQVFEIQRKNTLNLARMDAEQRLERIRRIENYLQDEERLKELYKAMYNDLRKPETEVIATEVGVVQAHITHIKRNLHKWMKNKKVPTPLPLVGTRSHIRYDPKGVVLIISPWNFPFNLSLVPLVYAIAAGNAVILKPSEMAAHTSSYISIMMYELFDESEVAVFEGNEAIAQELLDLPFNHIFFTGSPRVGKIIMSRAAQHLSSVTLELGGKSPAIIDETANVEKITKNLVWAKFINNGQACITPDYIIVHESVRDRFVKEFGKALNQLYDPSGKGIQNCPDYCRIINDHHFGRLRSLYNDACEKDAQVLYGGDLDDPELYIAPTLLDNVSDDMKIMQEEVFGPLLPMITYSNREDVHHIIENNPSPLILYIASQDQDNIDYFMDNISSGSTLTNDYMLSYSNPYLPFGGINNSGIGKTLGFHGFVGFSNERAVMQRKWGSMGILYPPYNEKIQRILKFIYRRM
ncbi:aldehyde dehydrogenase family protein [Methanococcoides methylutens]|uniref:aldehyde dehydrogenase family protein n=1 Tax=Methanococcoides methylutens TaxID=2226 RepID=UPI004043C2F3